MKECYVKCDNGFLATIRSDVITSNDIIRLHKTEGLTNITFIGGNPVWFREFYAMTRQVLKLKREM